MLSLCADEIIAGKFPTPVSAAEDLNNKLTEVRSTIKFQLTKVLCLGVAVGHVQMSDDQVVANVMLSMPILSAWIHFFHSSHQVSTSSSHCSRNTGKMSSHCT